MQTMNYRNNLRLHVQCAHNVHDASIDDDRCHSPQDRCLFEVVTTDYLLVVVVTTEYNKKGFLLLHYKFVNQCHEAFLSDLRGIALKQCKKQEWTLVI